MFSCVINGKRALLWEKSVKKELEIMVLFPCLSYFPGYNQLSNGNQSNEELL